MGRLILNNITVRYAERVVLDGITLSFHIPQFVAIVGPNGVGKSTLAKALAGVVPYEGEIYLEDTHTMPSVGFVWQNPDYNFIASTVWEEVVLSFLLRNTDRQTAYAEAEALLKEFGLWRYKDRNISTLSGGYKQVLAILTMIALSPDAIIFDEITSMLDIKERYMVLGFLHTLARRVLVILITQREEDLKYASRVIGINNKTVVYDGSPEHIWHSAYKELGLQKPYTYLLTEKWGKPWKPLGLMS